jgi:hypothetical protein
MYIRVQQFEQCNGPGLAFEKYRKFCTDRKENNIFLIYKETQKGAVAKSYMTNSLLIYD